MLTTPTSLYDLAQKARAAEGKPLHIELPDGALQSGFHLTEIKSAAISSIDCGRNTHSWTETVLQILDGAGGPRMSSSKLASILEVGLKTASGADNVLRFETAHRGQGLRTYILDRVEETGEALTLRLEPLLPACKPAGNWMGGESGDCGCYAAGEKATCC